MDMDMDGKFHILGKPDYLRRCVVVVVVVAVAVVFLLLLLALLH